jgi:radical SAM superfamily enzyme YgiQ (UPF0313 family)
MGQLLLVNPPINCSIPTRGLALPILASYVFEHTDKDVTLYDMANGLADKNQQFQELKDKVKACDILGFSIFTSAYPVTINILKKLKDELGELPFVVTGGAHPTACPAETVIESENLIDAAIIGRGEIPLASMCNGKDLEKIINTIPNIAYRSKNSVKFTKPKQLEHIDVRIASEVLEYCYYKTDNGGTLSELAKYGCGNNCDYCSCVKNKIFKRSPTRIADEVAELAGKRKITRLHFVDDNHFSDMEFLQTIENELREHGVEVNKTGNLDLSSMEAGDVNKIMKLGYTSAFVGRDFITNRLAEIYGRRAKGKIRDVESEKKKLDQLVEAKLHLSLSYILPAPHYTLGEVLATVEEMVSYSTEHIRVRAGPLTPFPGTAIRKKLQQEGLLDESRANRWGLYNIGFASDVYKYKDEYVQKWRNLLRWQVSKMDYFEEVFGYQKYGEYTCPLIYATATFGHKDFRINKLLKNSERDLGNLFRHFIKFSKDIDEKPKEMEKFVKFIKGQN